MKLPFRPNVCIILYNRDYKLLLGERYKEAGIFQFPQGGVEEGSSLEENVLREIEEELGIGSTLVRIKRKLNATHTYDFSTIPDYAVGRWRGQTQTFWLVEFLGTESDINVNTGHPEFMSVRWYTAQEVRTVAELKRRPGYEAPLCEVEEYFKSL